MQVIGEPDLNAKVAIVTGDSANTTAVRTIATNATAFPDYSHPDCLDISIQDGETSTQLPFPAPTPTPSPTPSLAPPPRSAPKPSPVLNRRPSTLKPGSVQKVPAPNTSGEPADYRISLTIQVSERARIRTVTPSSGHDCKSLVVFRPWNE